MPKDRNSDNSKDATRQKFWKFLVLLLLLGAGIIAVIVRLFIVQVIESDKYSDRARRLHESKVTLRAERGRIFDRNGRLLSTNVKCYSVAIDPRYYKHKNPKEQKLLSNVLKKICRNLAAVGSRNAESYMKMASSGKGAFVWLERGIPAGKVSDLKKIDSRGLILIEEPRRHLLYGHVGAQVLGFTGIDNVGISGIEKQLDTVLSGKNGYIIMLRDAFGRLRPTAEFPVKKPEHGNDLQLTIDIHLQRIVEFEIEQAVKKYNAASGTVIAMSPETGEILAMASYPGFNPNTYADNPVGTMRNRSITDSYEPGSTFKLIAAAAALEEGLVSTGQVFNAYGGKLQYPEYTIRDDHPADRLTFAEAMRHSSNIVFSQVAAGFSNHTFYKYMRDFGFGLSTDIELPGEVNGKIPRPKDYYTSTKRFMGHGYGITVTSLQLLNAYAAVANGGKLMKPHLVKKIYDTDSKSAEEIRPQKIRRVISPKTADTLNRLLTDVVENGTGKHTFIQGMDIAGKTGTAQKIVNRQYSKSDYTASFVGYFPAGSPKIAMIVTLDRPLGNYYGGSTAAPTFRNIALSWISVSPEYSFSSGERKNRKAQDSVIVPSVCGLFSSQAEELLANAGLKIKSNEGGVIILQEPKAGVIAEKNSYVSVETLSEIKDDSLKMQATVKPDVRGLSLRRAMTILHNSGNKVEVRRNGIVRRQSWKTDEEGKPVCILECR